ncbi:MAG: HEPN domain-containing protein [Rhodothermales bacterium]
MKPESQALFAKANRALRTAKLCLDDGDAVGSLNRAYYAAFYAASAALHQAGEMTKTHNGAMKQFHARFVATGDLPGELGGIFRQAYEFRERADYDAMTVFEEAGIHHLIEDVSRFIADVERLTRQRI